MRSSVDLDWLRQPRTVFLVLVVLGVVAVGGASVLSLLGRWIWLFDLFAAFRLQYAALLLIAVIAALAVRSWRVTGAVGLVFAVHLLPLMPLVVGGDQPDGPGAQFRLIQFNVLLTNRDIDEAGRWLVGQDADLIVIQEATAAWVEGLDRALDDGWTRLPAVAIRSDSFGMAVYARDGLAVASSEVIEEASLPAIVIRLPLESGGELLVYAIHTLPPTGGRNVDVAERQLDRAAGVITAHQGPAVLIGDLNATRWSAPFGRLREASGLRDAAEGFGIGGTWPSRLGFTGMIRIDHVLVSDDVRVDANTVGPHLGSDHRPVVVDLTVVAATSEG